MRTRLIGMVVVAALFTSPSVSAAELTDVLASFDFDNDNPFDIKLQIKYEYTSESANLLREGVDSTEKVLKDFNKLSYERAIHVMRIGIGMGLYKDLEFRLDLPIVMSDSMSLGFHPSLPAGDERNQVKDIDPSEAAGNTDAIFDIPFKGPTRSGLGDIGFGLRWAPRHYNRDPEYASWVIGATLRAPTATVKRANNTAVGEGLLQVEVNTAISRRVVWFFEPFFDLHGVIKVPSSSSLFDMANESTQTLEQPGNSLGLTIGAEFIPWEMDGGKRKVSIELGFGLDYVFEGREYTELFEALGTSRCSAADGCFGSTYTFSDPKVLRETVSALSTEVAKENDPAKKATLQAQLDAARSDLDGAPVTDGITDVEHYGIYSFLAALNVRPIEYFSFGVAFKLASIQPHFITFADAGKDLDGINGVETNSDVSGGVNEYNPKYIKELDEIGNRFKTSEKLNWSLMFNLTGRY